MEEAKDIENALGWVPEPDRQILLTDALAGIRRALGKGSVVKVTGSQNHFADDDDPSWTVRIEGEANGFTINIEVDGPSLPRLIIDVARIFGDAGTRVPELEVLRGR